MEFPTEREFVRAYSFNMEITNCDMCGEDFLIDTESPTPSMYITDEDTGLVFCPACCEKGPK